MVHVFNYAPADPREIGDLPCKKYHYFGLEMKAASSLHLVTDPRKSSLFCLAPWGLVEPFWSRTLAR
jgi:hypothetical protein